jgi:hypothetical protein
MHLLTFGGTEDRKKPNPPAATSQELSVIVQSEIVGEEFSVEDIPPV